MEIRQRVRDVAVEDGWALIRVLHVPDRPGIAAQIFGRVAAEGLSVDMILQNASVERSTDVSFTVRSTEVPRALRLMGEVQDQIGAKGVEAVEDLAKIQLVGTGILTDPSYLGNLFGTLAEADVNILCIGTSEVRISCLVEAPAKERALRALHKAFRTDAAAPSG